MTNRRTKQATSRRLVPASAVRIRLVLVATGAIAVMTLGGCTEKPPCEALVQTMCGTVGAAGCDKLKEHPPTDAEACAAVLGDQAELLRQIDALKAASAALSRTPAPAAAPKAAP